MGQKHRIYNEWTKGPYGAGSPLTGEYNAVNCQVYKSGALGPRPGWRPWGLHASTSPTSPNPTGFNQSADILRTAWAFQDAAGNEYVAIWYFDDSATSNDMELFTLDALNDELDLDSTHNPASGPVAWTEVAPVEWGGPVHYNSWWDGVEAVAIGQLFYSDFPGTVVTMTGKPNTPFTAIYRDRMYGTGATSNASRIYYSDEADYTNWDSNSFFDLYPTNNASEAAVVGMWETSNSLLIATRNGKWWTLTGASPETGTLRQVDQGPIPWNEGGGLLNGYVYFMNEQGKGIVVAAPAGLNTKALSHLDLRYIPLATASRPATNDTLIGPFKAVTDEVNEYIHLAAGEFASHQACEQVLAIEMVNGVWQYHTYDFDSSTGDHVLFFAGWQPNVMWMLVQDDDVLYIASRNICLDRPARETDTFSQPLANTDEGGACLLDLNTTNEARVVLGDISHSTGGLVKPLSLVLDIEYWWYDFSTATFGYPDLTVDVEVLGLDSDSDAEVSNTTITFSANTDSWEQMPSNATAGNRGIVRRLEAPIEDMPYGSRIRVTMDFTAIAIHKATMYYDEQEASYP